MSTKDHNKTLVILYAAIGSFYSCGIIGAPWIIEKNFRRPEQIPTAILVFGLVFLIAVLFWLSAIYMHRKKRIGRTLGAHRRADHALRVLARGSLCLVVHAY
jgi:hypothetical protein